jgi:hypothetical protein
MYYIIYLDMFRAILCSSSGGQNCIPTAFGIVTLCERPCGLQSALNRCTAFFMYYLSNKCNFCKTGVSDSPILLTDANDFVSIDSLFIPIMLWLKCDKEYLFCFPKTDAIKAVL